MKVMLKRQSLLWASLALVGACSHFRKEAKNTPLAPADYQEKLYQRVGRELSDETKRLRKPAAQEPSLALLKASLKDLNKLKPGRFEIYVFPKIQSMNHKEMSANKEILLGKPHVVEMSVIAVTSCQYLLSKQGFKKYSPQKYFSRSLGTDKKSQCAIIEASSPKMRHRNKSLWRNGDVMAKRIYLDDHYDIHGIEVDYYAKDEKQKDLNLKTLGFKWVPGQPSTAALDFLPIDLPAMRSLAGIEAVPISRVFDPSSSSGGLTYTSGAPAVDAMALRQIGRLNRKFKVPACDLKAFSYRDLYRKNIQMFWCSGTPWPQVVDDPQFIAVTQNLSTESL